MFSEFAYSKEMQIILMFFSFFFNFIIMYLNAKLILRIYGENVTIKQKALFAFLSGTVLQSMWIYFIYFIGGMVSFTPMQNLLITSPSPITALFYCFLGIKILKLSPIRSIELMGHIYLYYTIINCLNRLAGSFLFTQTDPMHFNYLLDAMRHVFNLIICIIIYLITWYILDKNPKLFVSKSSTFARPKLDLIVFILKSSLVYICVVTIPSLVPQAIIANSFIFIILALFFIATLLFKFYQHEKADIHNKETHINSLIKSLDEFRAIKHDFNNILQTYNGYFAIGDLEGCKKYHQSFVNTLTQAEDTLTLSSHMKENPALISLLIDKYTLAKSMKVQMDISLKCSLSNLPISEIDIGRIIACLLDNAIEAANQSEQRRVSLTIEQKKEMSKLIIITNSTSTSLDISQMLTAKVTTKTGHQGIGLSNVQKIIGKYGNCTFQMNYYNNEVTCYIELINNKRYNNHTYTSYHYI